MGEDGGEDRPSCSIENKRQEDAEQSDEEEKGHWRNKLVVWSARKKETGNVPEAPQDCHASHRYHPAQSLSEPRQQEAAPTKFFANGTGHKLQYDHRQHCA